MAMIRKTDAVVEDKIKKLRKLGYEKVFLVKDKPNDVYKPHFHFTDNVLVILRGRIKITKEGRTKSYKTGETVSIPKMTKHSALVGSEGCDYVFGER